MIIRLLQTALIAAALPTAAAAQEPPPTPRPIPNAGNWTFVERLPMVDHPTCVARLPGAEVNLTLILNNNGIPLLIAARGDWSGLSGETDVTLVVDGAAPVHLQGGMVHNLVIMMIGDAALLDRLRAAHRVELTLPAGRLGAEVTGLGTALDAVRACAAAAAGETGHDS